jgi:ABC-2 type transport system permease protein
MFHELVILKKLLGIQIRSQLQYKSSFMLDILGTATTSLLSIFTVYLVFQEFQDLAGWTFLEIAFLFGMAETSFGIMDMVFSGFDPQAFGQSIRRGTFDQLLLRPINLSIQVLGSRFIIRRIGRILQGIIVLLLVISELHIIWTPGKLFYIPIVLISQVIFFGSLFIIGATITFWTIESIEVVNVFTYGGTEMISYPMSIYPDWMVRFFTFIIPAIFLNYYPAIYILERLELSSLPQIFPFLSPLASIMLFVLAHLIWKVGIRKYQSTGT